MDNQNTKIDFEFISELEGRLQTKGYIPAGRSKSGVTISTGIDIGQMNALEISQLDISEVLKKKLALYAGKIKKEAKKYLTDNPLTITEDEAKKLYEAVKARHINSLIKNYNASSSFDFCELPKEAQTVIASVAFQYGVYLQQSAPMFWSAVIKKDWKKAYEILLDFKEAYSTRRKKEAKYLEPLINISPKQDSLDIREKNYNYDRAYC